MSTIAAQSQDYFELLLEGQQFDNYGGWMMDSQFQMEMGSPYLLAHGLPTPCADARTNIYIPKSGLHRIWVRTKDWSPDAHPGAFQVIVNDKPIDHLFGTNGKDWNWELAEDVWLNEGENKLALHDLGGFDARVDAVYITNTNSTPPNYPLSALRSWKKRLLGLQEPETGGVYDVIVAGSGMAGIAAAYAAASMGCSVCLIEERDVLGGNACMNIGLTPEGTVSDACYAFSERQENGDLNARRMLEDMGVHIQTNKSVFSCEMDGRKITFVSIRDNISARETVLSASEFIDCTGKALLGYYAGLPTMAVQEGQSCFDESLAPQNTDFMHHGNTLMFRTEMGDSSVSFPDVSWTKKVAKDYADLSGQIGQVSCCCGHGPYENRPGPHTGPDKTPPRRKDHEEQDSVWENAMSFPKTHFWEYGQYLDPYQNGEYIRDTLLQAVIGTYDNVRKSDPEKYANLRLAYLSPVSAQGEVRRYLGAHVLTEKEIRDHVHFPDCALENSSAFCLHYPGNPDYDFRLGSWKWVERDGLPYEVPLSCLYSPCADNLWFAGKHISVSHIAGSSTKLMGNGFEQGQAAGLAAAMCIRKNTTPASLGQNHMEEFRKIFAGLSKYKQSESESDL